MAENPSERIGKIAEEQAALHFMIRGYAVFWPTVDNGADFVVLGKDGEYLGVQVKKRGAARSSKHSSEAYDLLAIVGQRYIWVIPANAIRRRRGGVDVRPKTSKWHKYREERLHWEKPAASA